MDASLLLVRFVLARLANLIGQGCKLSSQVVVSALREFAQTDSCELPASWSSEKKAHELFDKLVKECVFKWNVRYRTSVCRSRDLLGFHDMGNMMDPEIRAAGYVKNEIKPLEKHIVSELTAYLEADRT